MMIHLSDMVYFVNNHLSDEALAFCAEALNEDKLESLPPSVKEHIESCRICKKEIYAISESSRFTHSNNRTRRDIRITMKNLNPGIRRVIYIAGTAAAVFILGGLLILMKNTPVKKQESLSQITEEKKVPGISTPEVNKNEELSDSKKYISDLYIESEYKSSNTYNLKDEAYKESAFFENITQSAFRGSSDVNIKPENGIFIKINQPIAFEFDSVTSGPVSLILYNNKGENIFKATDITEQNYLLKTPLAAGLYYWKLESSADLLHLGKFYVITQ